MSFFSFFLRTKNAIIRPQNQHPSVIKHRHATPSPARFRSCPAGPPSLRRRNPRPTPAPEPDRCPFLAEAQLAAAVLPSTRPHPRPGFQHKITSCLWSQEGAAGGRYAGLSQRYEGDYIEERSSRGAGEARWSQHTQQTQKHTNRHRIQNPIAVGQQNTAIMILQYLALYLYFKH